jgi:hypothetical protein
MASSSEGEWRWSQNQIERTRDAKRLKIKSWTCQDCGSMHSQSQDARRQWLDKHHGQLDRRGTRPEDGHKGKPAGKRK